MDSRKLVFKETAVVAVGQAVCIAIMLGIFALLGAFDRTVLVGALVGGVLAILNFFFMAVSAMIAADNAQKQSVSKGKAAVQISYILRLIVLFVVLFAFAKSGLGDPLALVLPLIFVRPTLTIAEFFRKKGD